MGNRPVKNDLLAFPLPMSHKIPVILVTGFLGSGKTTFLRRIAKAHPELRLLFLVNEFGGKSIDGPILGETGRPTHSVVGGSLFCECKAPDFARTMETDVLAEHRRQPLDAVVIETSGIADPEAIGRVMKTFGLDIAFQVQRIISVISPHSFLKLVGNLSNIAAQIRTSDLVLINKTDLASEERIREAEEIIERIHPGVETMRCQYGEVPFTFAVRKKFLPERDLSTADANPYATCTVPFSRQVSKPALEAWLAALPASVLRVKGTVRTHQGWFQVERTLEASALVPGSAVKDPSLVLIVHEEDEKLLEEIARDLNGAG